MGDFFDDHFVIIGLDGKENAELKSKIKDQLKDNREWISSMINLKKDEEKKR